MTDTVSYLKNNDLFSGLDESALKSLAASAVVRRLAPREYLFSEGAEGLYFFVLISGSIRVFKTSAEGRESTIKIIHPGELFAEAVLFTKRNYPASAVATETSEVICLHRNSFSEMIGQDGPRNAFIMALFDKLRFLTDQIHYLSSHDVEDRFFMFLKKNYGPRNRYDITISKKDIASAIGATPETFSRLILRLTRLGLIAWKKNTLLVREGLWDKDYFDE